MDICIKCADISNPAKPTEIAYDWSMAVMEEFFKQGDKERDLKLPVSKFMDRAKDIPNIPKCQIGFIEFIVYPLFEAWDLYMLDESDEHIALNNIRKNKQSWEARYPFISQNTLDIHTCTIGCPRIPRQTVS